MKFSLFRVKNSNENSFILSLAPLFYENNYLCVDRCLKHAYIPTNSKNQIILFSKDHYLPCLITKEIHVQNAHVVGREHALIIAKTFLDCRM